MMVKPQRRRIVIPLEKEKPIGLELDFSEETTQGAGVRVSRVEPGLAKRLGVIEEDRLTFIGHEDVRKAGFDRVREMLQEPTYPTELVVEGPPLGGIGSTPADSGDHPAQLPHTPRQHQSPLTRINTSSATGKPRGKKRRREATVPPPRTSSMPPPAAPAPPPPTSPIQGGLIEQLDFLVAQQESKDGGAPPEAVAPLISSRRRAAQAEEPSVSSSTHAESENAAAAPLYDRHPIRQHEGNQDERGPDPHDRRQQKDSLDPTQETGEEGVDVVLIGRPQQSGESRHRRHHYSHPRNSTVRSEMEGRRSVDETGVGGRDRQGDNVLSFSLLPAWLGCLVSLGLQDMTGSDSARAAVIVREMRNTMAKELAVLQRAHQVSAHVTLSEYSAFRGSRLLSCPGYCTLKTLEEQYLDDPDDELAKIAETCFVSDLIGDTVKKTNATPLPAAGASHQQHVGVGPNDQPLISYNSVDVARAKAISKETGLRVKFVRKNHCIVQQVIRQALACHERAVDARGAHRSIRRQSLLDVKEARSKSKKTEHQASIVISKIRGWEKTARVSEALAVQQSGAVTERGEMLRDAVELLMSGLETQKKVLEVIETFRMLNGPLADGWETLFL